MVNRSQPLLTIGIPTYNRAECYLPLALSSALAQDYANLEIIVSDNASADETEAYVRSVADARIRYFRHEKNIGAAQNQNFCVEKARGAFFLLLHDDDLIDPDFISVCAQAVRGNSAVGVVRTGVRLIDAEGRVLSSSENSAAGLSFEDFLRAWFSGETLHYLPATMFNTGALKRLGGFHSRTYMFEDAVVLVRLAAELGRVDVRDVKASFRRHGENLGGHPSHALSWVDDCMFLRDVILESISSADQEWARADANRFLARKSYRHAAGLSSFSDRWMLYWTIYRTFGHRHLPPPLQAAKWSRRLQRRLGKFVPRVNTGL